MDLSQDFDSRYENFPDNIPGVTRDIRERRGVSKLRDCCAPDIAVRSPASLVIANGGRGNRARQTRRQNRSGGLTCAGGGARGQYQNFSRTRDSRIPEGVCTSSSVPGSQASLHTMPVATLVLKSGDQTAVEISPAAIAQRSSSGQ